MDDGNSPCERPKRTEFERWREAYPRGSDEAARAASKPHDIATAELLLGLMERFNYPNLAAVREEDAEILYLLECESYGYKRDTEEELAEREAEAERLRNGQ